MSAEIDPRRRVYYMRCRLAAGAKRKYYGVGIGVEEEKSGQTVERIGKKK